ncbi:uncharacterized protein LOC128181564 isoform X1 [Crassostrea angulata]|uniref:uncharacterized protein LOC128181564 isoform X1 n=1 Tax=Magallana angulata TaxID=2784310 RepID=UPI0022B176A1|nr:uncharacterized protein LOC128181564 isoform X1 [Crassostrea angulata]
MWNSDNEFQFDLNPYDSFMRKHLEHYGYYTAQTDKWRNQGFRHNFSSYAEWEKTYGYQLSSGSGSESDDSDLDSDEKKNAVEEKRRSYHMRAGVSCESHIKGYYDENLSDNKLQEELLRTTQLVYSYKDGKGMVPKLREPRNLYALAKELGPQQAARWPADIQVLDEKVKHIRYIPPDPELFYKPTGCEKTPMVRGEENGGRLVYMYEPRSTFFVRSRVGGLRSGPQKCNIELQSEEDDTLIFESRFESGNLAKAVQVNSTDYELWLRYDLYTNKHTQWFYFRVSNTRANKTYRFTIVNFMKSDSLYNDGMKPLIYSEKNAQQKKVGWVRGGSDIKYYKNNLSLSGTINRYSTSKSDKSFYSLTWTVKLEHNHDTVYFAHCFPYTYTDLQDYLLDMSNDPVKNKICKQRVLCRTLAGNLVYLLSITSPTQNSEDMKHKKAVVITSRVHPGECNSSWMMKGFLDYLTGNSADAKLLRDTFIFKIVPMLNPDGVIVGNYRCSLAGRDLNRNYKTVLKDSYPSVWHTKNMIRKLLQEREIIVYCDLHGHSRKQNVFIYGCENRHNPEKRLKERVFPLMLNKNAPDKFKFESCKFKVQKSKEGTGRIVMWNMGIMNSYTMEATFCGSTMGKKKGYHFSMADFEALGYHFCDTLLDYCDPDNTKSCNILLEIEERLKREIMVKLQKAASTSMPDINDINLSDYSSEDVESSDGGSDSSVSDGPPVHLQFTASRPTRPHSRPYIRVMPFDWQPTKKKKKLKTKKERDRVRSLKDEPKKPAAADRPVSDPHACEKKPILTGHQQAHAKQEKLSSPSGGMKYTLAVKRPKSSEEHASQPIINDEKSEQRARRAYTTLFDPRDHSDYLEALTNAYLRNGLLTQDQAAPHFRYSGNKVSPTIPFNLEGLCPHHEQTFAAQYMAQQIQNINSGDPDWLLHGIRGRPKILKPFRQKNQDEIIAKLLGMPAVVAPEVSLTHTPDLRVTDSVVTSMAYSGPFDALVTPQLLLKGGQQAGAVCPPIRPLPVPVVGNTFVKVWKDRIHKSRRSNFPDPTIDEIVRSQISHQASIPMSRQPTQRHILEVSAAQQRQQDVLTQARRHQPAYPVTGRLCYRHKLAIRRDQINPNLVLIQDSLTHTFILQGDKSGNSIRQHPNPFDEQYTHAKNSRPRAHVPETSFNNYEPLDNHKKPPHPPEEHLPPSQGDATEETTAKEEPVMEEEEEIDHRKHGHKGKHKEKGGRKSRMVEETNVLYQFSQEKRVPSYVPTCVQESINPIELALERKFSVVIPQENNVPFLTTREIKNPGMRESDDDPGPSTEGPDYLQDPHHHNGPRVKSAKGGKEMDSVVESIKELRQSLANNAMQQNHLSPTTGGYIKRLMRETGEEIEELTNEIRHDIEQGHRLAKDRDKQKAKEIKKFQSLDDYKMNENRNSNSQALSIGNKSKTVLTREPPGNSFDDKRPFNARYKSKSVTNYPISDRTHDRNQKWRDPSLMITGDTSLNYSNTYITNARKSTSETVYTIPASSANATHVNSSGASVYRNSLNLNTTSTATQTSSKMEKAFPRVELYPDTDHPIRLADANGYAMTNTKSKSAKDLRDGITNVITGKEDRKSDKYFEFEITGLTLSTNKYRSIGKYLDHLKIMQHQNRVRSAKSGRQSVGKQSVTPSSLTESIILPKLVFKRKLSEAVPTKIQLMISQDHQEEKAFGGQFLPLSRTIRAPFYRNNSKRK